MTPPFRVQAPWRLDGAASIALSIDDARLLGSNSRRIRFELYPLVAPAQGSRHHGYWDLPLNRGCAAPAWTWPSGTGGSSPSPTPICV